jgi:hypothetical protein
MATGAVDDERTCAVNGCNMPAPATVAQVEYPARIAELLREAENLELQAKARRAEAARVDAMVKADRPPAWLCRSCRTHLHDPELMSAWVGGTHNAGDRQLIDRTRDYLLNHPPNARGACVVCTPGARPQRGEQIPA